MGGWFNIDSKFYRFCSYIGDFIILMVLWAIFSLPVITVGASTTAAYYVATRQLSSREGYIWKDFLKSFKSNFIQSTLSTIIFGIIGAVIYINIEFLEKSSIFFPVQFVLLYELTITVIYTFPLLSRFNFKFFKLLKTAFLMANKHLLTTISCLILLGAGFTDTFRHLYPDAIEEYSWWSYMGKARERNTGWRIDYFITSKRLDDKIQEAKIHQQIFGSDHCPVELDIDL